MKSQSIPGTLFLAGGILSCSQPSSWVPSNGHPSHVLVVAPNDRPVHINAVSLSNGDERIEIDEADAESAAIIDVQLARSLDEYGIQPGWQEPVRGSFPKWERLYEANAVHGDVSEWLEVQELPSSLAGMGIAMEVSDCATFDVQDIELPGSFGRAHFTIDLDGTSALVGTDSGFFRVSDSTAERLSALDGLPVLGAHRAQQEIWLYGTGGTVAHGTLEGGFTRTSTLGFNPLGQASLDGVETDHGLELFATGESRILARMRADETWETLATLDEASLGDGASVVAVAPGRAFALIRRGQEVFDWQEGELRRTRLAEGTITGSLGELYSLARVPGLGIWAGGRYGRLYRFQDAWELVDSEGPGGHVTFIVPMHGGVVFGGGGGVVAQWYPSGEACEPTTVGHNGRLMGSAAAVGDGVLLVDEDAIDGHPIIARWIRARSSE